ISTCPRFNIASRKLSKPRPIRVIKVPLRSPSIFPSRIAYDRSERSTSHELGWLSNSRKPQPLSRPRTSHIQQIPLHLDKCPLSGLVRLPRPHRFEWHDPILHTHDGNCTELQALAAMESPDGDAVAWRCVIRLKVEALETCVLHSLLNPILKDVLAS